MLLDEPEIIGRFANLFPKDRSNNKHLLSISRFCKTIAGLESNSESAKKIPESQSIYTFEEKKDPRIQ